MTLRAIPLPDEQDELARPLGEGEWVFPWGGCWVRGRGPEIRGVALRGETMDLPWAVPPGEAGPTGDGAGWPTDLAGFQALPGRLDGLDRDGRLLKGPDGAPLVSLLLPADGTNAVLVYPDRTLVLGDADPPERRLGVRAIPMRAHRSLQLALESRTQGLGLLSESGEDYETPLAWAGATLQARWAAHDPTDRASGLDPCLGSRMVVGMLAAGLPGPGVDSLDLLLGHRPMDGLFCLSALGAWRPVPSGVTRLLPAILEAGRTVAGILRGPPGGSEPAGEADSAEKAGPAETARLMARAALMGAAAAVEGAGASKEAAQLRIMALGDSGASLPLGARGAGDQGLSALGGRDLRFLQLALPGLLDVPAQPAGPQGGLLPGVGAGSVEPGFSGWLEAAATLPARIYTEILGARGDAGYGRLHLDLRLSGGCPEGSSGFACRGIRLGDATVALRYHPQEGSRNLSLFQGAGAVPVNAVVTVRLPRKPGGFEVDRRPAEAEWAPTDSGWEARLQLPLEGERSLSFRDEG